MVLKTYPCDDNVADGESYLRADYSISCGTSLHMFFKLYAGIMIMVSRLPSQKYSFDSAPSICYLFTRHFPSVVLIRVCVILHTDLFIYDKVACHASYTCLGIFFRRV